MDLWKWSACPICESVEEWVAVTVCSTEDTAKEECKNCGFSYEGYIHQREKAIDLWHLEFKGAK